MNTMQQTDSLQPGPVTTPRTNRYTTYQQILLAILCLALTIAAYKCIILKAFVGDDHVHLIWLNEAVKHPSMVLRNFYSNWMYADTSPQCYRPIISVFMFTDYLIWHRNAVGFHITNLLFLGLSSLALYGCVSEVLRWSPSSQRRLWPVLSAGTFALYPSHPEAVSWVTGRVDAIVTAFYLCSLYAYMVWRRTNDLKMFCCSIATMLLALASKEMAVTIPVVFAVFELLKPTRLPAETIELNGEASESGTNATLSASGIEHEQHATLTSRISKVGKCTAAAWIILVGYFLLRRIALGTFIGGYDNTLSADWHLLLQHWYLGLGKLFIPINDYYLDANKIVINLWCGITALLYAVAAGFLLKKKSRNQLLFFLAFAAISFVPVYKLLDGMPDLQGTRFSYLASAPISALFAFGLASIPLLFRQKRARGGNIIQITAAVCYFLIASYMLWVNNQPWSRVSHWAANMEKDFNQIMDHATSADHFIYFNIPNNYRGAYLARNATGDLGQHQDIDWTPIETDDKLRETGQLRDSIAAGTKQYKCFYWNEQTGHFIPIELPPVVRAGAAKEWNSLVLQNRVKVLGGVERLKFISGGSGGGGGIADSGGGAGSIDVSAGDKPAMLMLDLQKLSPWQIDFVRLNISREISKNGVNDNQFSLLTSTPVMPPTMLQPSVIAYSGNSNQPSRKTSTSAIFGLRLLPGWFCAKDGATAVLIIPQQWSGTLSIDIPDKRTIAPLIQRTSTARYVTPANPLHYKMDVSGIDGATGVLVQISRKNLFFTHKNSSDFEQALTSKSIKVNTQKAELVLPNSDFSGSGAYQVRCWAVDSRGNTVGLCSDCLVATLP